jgi:hypothetical protein
MSFPEGRIGSANIASQELPPTDYFYWLQGLL